MDQLAATGGLDGAMMLTMAKMYTSVKESPYTRDEVRCLAFGCDSYSHGASVQ